MDALVVGVDPADPRRWRLTGPDVGGSLSAMNAYLGYLADRNYSPRTVRTYGYGLLAFARWLAASGLSVEAVGTCEVLDFLAACRQESVRGRPGPNVLDLNGNRTDRLAPASINLRLAAGAALVRLQSGWVGRTFERPTAYTPRCSGHVTSTRP